jgi:RNA polymerase-binding transcription factor
MYAVAIDEEKVRTRLEARHSELRREIAAMLDEDASLGLSSPGVEDTGDTAQDFQEVRQDNSMLLNERNLLAAVEEALRRLRDGTYGLCIDCGQPIPEKRLEAIPWAVRDRACQERCEK